MSATAFVGFRPWNGTDIYIDPEITQGFGLSDTVVSLASPTRKRKRQASRCRVSTWRACICSKRSASAANRRLSRTVPTKSPESRTSRGITIIAGKLSVTDFFDNNAYAHDGRTQFLNWQCLLLRLL